MTTVRLITFLATGFLTVGCFKRHEVLRGKIVMMRTDPITDVVHVTLSTGNMDALLQTCLQPGEYSKYLGKYVRIQRYMFTCRGTSQIEEVQP